MSEQISKINMNGVEYNIIDADLRNKINNSSSLIFNNDNNSIEVDVENSSVTQEDVCVTIQQYINDWGLVSMDHALELFGTREQMSEFVTREQMSGFVTHEQLGDLSTILDNLNGEEI